MKKTPMYCNPSDEEISLICRAQQEDEAAMRVLLDRHQPLLNSLAHKLCGNAREEDLLQAGRLGLMQAIAHYDADKGAKLITYAVPWILGEMRRAMREAMSCWLSLEEDRDKNAHSLLDVLPSQDSLNIEQLDLRMALARLPEPEQILVALRYFRGRTQKETACMLHKSQAQICRMERRALDRLHAWLL